MSCPLCQARRQPQEHPPLDGLREVPALALEQLPWVERHLYQCACGTHWEVGREQHHFRDDHEVTLLWERDPGYAQVLYGPAAPSVADLKALYGRLPPDADRIRLWLVLRHLGPQVRQPLAADPTAPELLRRTARQVQESVERGE